MTIIMMNFSRRFWQFAK